MLQIRYKNSDKGSMWLVESRYTFGSDSQCDILVEGGNIKPLHASIEVKGDQVVLINHGDDQVDVNGESVVTSSPLSPGDNFGVGSIQLELVDPKTTYKAQANKAKPDLTSKGWSLRALNSAMSENRYPLNGISVIGRSKECDISLSLVHLSRKHAQLTVTHAGLEIKDLNSSNGTFVNGQKISTYMLKSGDELSFDTLKFRVEGPDTAENETILRGVKDDDGQTTVRPALVKQNLKPKSEQVASRQQAAPKRGASAQEAKPSLSPTAHTAPTTPVKKKSNSNIVGWVFIAGIAVLFIAYAIYSGLIPLG